MSQAKRVDTGDVDPLLNFGCGKPNSDSTKPIAKQALARKRVRRPQPHPLAQMPRELAVFDGRDRIGMLIQRNGRCDAFDAYGVLLGTFANVRAAADKISDQYGETTMTEKQRSRRS